MADNEKKQEKQKEKIQEFVKKEKEKEKKQVVSPEILKPKPKEDKEDG